MYDSTTLANTGSRTEKGGMQVQVYHLFSCAWLCSDQALSTERLACKEDEREIFSPKKQSSIIVRTSHPSVFINGKRDHARSGLIHTIIFLQQTPAFIEYIFLARRHANNTSVYTSTPFVFLYTPKSRPKVEYFDSQVERGGKRNAHDKDKIYFGLSRGRI